MPYFQNVFDIDWTGSWITEDRLSQPQFRIKANRNTGDLMRAWATEPYNVAANPVLTINFAYDLDLKNYATLNVNVAGAVPAATTAIEVCNALNSDPSFAELWRATPVSVSTGGSAATVWPPAIPPGGGAPYPQAGAGFPGPYTVLLKSIKRPKQSMRSYVSNTGAEMALGFNRHAPVVQLPSYFVRHSVANRFNFPDSLGNLVLLDPANPVDQGVITKAGMDFNNPLPDWHFLGGKSEAFKVHVNTWDGTRLTRKLTYNVGAKPGDSAIATYYLYDAGGNVASEVTSPYVLQPGDIVTPPA